jgi:hypothetical protein
VCSVLQWTVLGRTSNISQPTIIAFSSVSDFQVRLPASDSNTSLLQLSVIIRDDLDCIAEANISSVSVLSDVTGITAMINTLQTSVDGLTSDPLVQLLSSGSQNVISQVLTSIAQELNLINNENMDTAVSSTFLAHPSHHILSCVCLDGIPAAAISVSSLGSDATQSVSLASSSSNTSAMEKYKQQINSYANARDYLMRFADSLLITTSNSIKLQAASLAQLTQSINQLTRTSAVITRFFSLPLTLTCLFGLHLQMIASQRCYQLARSLHSMATRIAYEDVLTASEQIYRCTANALDVSELPQNYSSIFSFSCRRSTDHCRAV